MTSPLSLLSGRLPCLHKIVERPERNSTGRRRNLSLGLLPAINCLKRNVFIRDDHRTIESQIEQDAGRLIEKFVSIHKNDVTPLTRIKLFHEPRPPARPGPPYLPRNRGIEVVRVLHGARDLKPLFDEGG
jgi:hypothetical protein